MRAVVALVLAGLVAGACALVSREPPDNVCDGDEDCFRAQGEVCNLEAKRCEPGPDAGVAGATADAPSD